MVSLLLSPLRPPCLPHRALPTSASLVERGNFAFHLCSILISEEGLVGAATTGTGCGAWNVCLADAGVVILLLSTRTAALGTGRGVGQDGRGCVRRALKCSESSILERRLNEGGLDTRKPSGQPARVASCDTAFCLQITRKTTFQNIENQVQLNEVSTRVICLT